MTSESSDDGDKKLPAEPTNISKVFKSKKKKRTGVYDRKNSRKQKKNIHHEKAWSEYSQFMNANLEKKKNHRESPHIVVNKSLHKIVENSIILKNPNISENNFLLRKIYYEIDKIGKNVKIQSIGMLSWMKLQTENYLF